MFDYKKEKPDWLPLTDSQWNLLNKGMCVYGAQISRLDIFKGLMIGSALAGAVIFGGAGLLLAGGMLGKIILGTISTCVGGLSCTVLGLVGKSLIKRNKSNVVNKSVHFNASDLLKIKEIILSAQDEFKKIGDLEKGRVCVDLLSCISNISARFDEIQKERVKKQRAPDIESAGAEIKEKLFEKYKENLIINNVIDGSLEDKLKDESLDGVAAISLLKNLLSNNDLNEIQKAEIELTLNKRLPNLVDAYLKIKEEERNIVNHDFGDKTPRESLIAGIDGAFGLALKIQKELADLNRLRLSSESNVLSEYNPAINAVRLK